MHRREWNRGSQGRRRQQSSSHYRKRSRSPRRPSHRRRRERRASPPHYFERNKSPSHSFRRSRSPAYYPGRSKSPEHYRKRSRSPQFHYLEKSQLPSHYLARRESPSHYVERKNSPSHNTWRNRSPAECLGRGESPSYNLERGESPSHYMEKNPSPPDYLRRSQSPACDLGGNNSPSQCLETSKSPFDYSEKNQYPTEYLRRSQSPDHYFETRDSPIHHLEKTESPTHYIEGNASPTPYLRRSTSPSHNFIRSESSVEYTEGNEYPPYDHSRCSKSPPQYFREESHSPYPEMRFDESSYLDHNDESPPHSMDTDNSEQYQFDPQQHDNNDEQHSAPFTAEGSPETNVFRERPLKFSMDHPKFPKRSISIKIMSIEEVDEIPNWRISAIRLTGGQHKKVKSLVRQGILYMEAKRTIIKEMVIKKRQKQMIACAQQQKDGKPKFKKRLENISVVHAGYPRVHLGMDKLRLIENALQCAHQHLPENGPQLFFRKCQYKTGFLLVRCLDKPTADWVKEVVPQLKPWKGAVLRIHNKTAVVPKPFKCMVFVPDADGERLSSDAFLSRLRISNPGLNSHLWMAVGKSAEENGVLWTFNMDVESLDLLEKVDLQPFYGLGRLKFSLHSAVV